MDTRDTCCYLFHRSCEFLPNLSMHIYSNSRPQLLATVAGGSRGISYIYAGRVISGVGLGGITAVSPAYASECSPKGARGRTTGVLTIMIGIGAMIAYFVNRKYAFSLSYLHLMSFFV